MTDQQLVALRFPCFLAAEMVNPRYGISHTNYSVIITVDAGYACREAKHGGPVWHASVAWHTNTRRGPWPIPLLSAPTILRMWERVVRALHRVGDGTLGEWRESGQTAIHVRRRMTAEEWGDKPWGMDYRYTPEYAVRIAPVAHLLPIGYRE